MHYSPSAQSPMQDESDELQTPQRSPSRLDFCMEDPEEDNDPPAHRMDWCCISLGYDCPYALAEQDAFVVDVAPPAPPRLPVVKDHTDDPPQTTDSHDHEITDTPSIFFAPPDPMDQVIIVPQAPIPVRPPSVQIQADAQEAMPPTRNAPQRLNYPHRGFSRSALEQQKSLWSSRHEEWCEWQSRMEQGRAEKQESKTNDAYTGFATPEPRVAVSTPPYMRIPPSGLERDLADHPSGRHSQDVHASIYPRMGDISALRDPYSANIDRSFFRLPLWTLHKTLYAFDMQLGSASAYDATHVQASMSSSTLSSYSLSTVEDDEESDSTLVADDSPVPKSQHSLEPLKSAWFPRGPPSWDRFCGWELSWYARWELLIGIFQYGHARHNVFDAPFAFTAPFESRVTTSPPSKRIFRFTVDEDEDEDEDYGTPLADSSFSADFDEECERALAFYNRELKCSEAVL